MGNLVQRNNLRDQIFGERITKSEFEKYEVVDWIKLEEDRNNCRQMFDSFRKKNLVSFETCVNII
jgi:hypothetical protein